MPLNGGMDVAKGWLWGSGSHINTVVALLHWKRDYEENRISGTF